MNVCIECNNIFPWWDEFHVFKNTKSKNYVSIYLNWSLKECEQHSTPWTFIFIIIIYLLKKNCDYWKFSKWELASHNFLGGQLLIYMFHSIKCVMFAIMCQSCVQCTMIILVNICWSTSTL
jgi:hypothetical protein